MNYILLQELYRHLILTGDEHNVVGEFARSGEVPLVEVVKNELVEVDHEDKNAPSLGNEI